MSPTPYTILLYHGVIEDRYADGVHNSSGKHVLASDFEDQMNYVRTHHPVVTMHDVAAAHSGDATIGHGSVAVTFDDGYLNNLESAWPILRRLSIPATIYLTTGYIGTRKLMWSDALEERMISAEGARLEFDILGEKSSLPIQDADAKIESFGKLKKICKELGWQERQELLDRLQVDTEMRQDSPFCAWLSWEDIEAWNESELIAFGAHTVDHLSLGKASSDVMRRQIDASLEDVSHATKSPCRLFAYPEGQEGDFNKEVIEHLRTRGLTHAPTAIAGVNTVEGTPPFELRRIMVGFEEQPFPVRLLSSTQRNA